MLNLKMFLLAKKDPQRGRCNQQMAQTSNDVGNDFLPEFANNEFVSLCDWTLSCSFRLDLVKE